MKILKLKQGPTFDVFLGRGWKNWTRVKFDVKTNKMDIIGGNPLRDDARNKLYLELMKRYNRNVKSQELPVSA